MNKQDFNECGLEMKLSSDVGENLCKTSISPGFDLNEFRKGLIKDLSASIYDELLGRKS
ncbi:14577_t:CDS:2 [Rhizophagus irregularis]|uniref:Uncharacterized protein n=1 Tax=Rhizophagus irregularis (strain DAOM 181602 / DAOM 197198 / MUCL 43194) TaxID=747089 RepID=U9TI26_RHIID|nr:14577_t:CDS:2 [Rhizophagus irregularis]